MQRIITAAVLLPLVILGIIYSNSQYFALGSAAVVGIAAWEWSNIAALTSPLLRILYVLLLCGLCGVAYFFDLWSLLLLTSLWWLLCIYWIARYPAVSQLWQTTSWLAPTAGVYLYLPFFIAFMELKTHQDGLIYLFILATSVVLADSAAYFTGKAFGKHKLAEKVSPGKTIEGCLGALLCTCLFAGAIGVWVYQDFTETLLLMLIVLITVIFSIVGDLFESMGKRIRGIKDSGRILPGHGGVCDRIDSFTAAAPIFVLLLDLSGQWL